MKRIIMIVLSVMLVFAMTPAIAFMQTSEANAQSAVAQVLDENGAPVGENNGTYETVEAAIGAVQDGGTVKLLSDVTLTSKLLISGGKTFTLDLGGETLTGRVNVSGAILTIKNGTIDGAASQALNAYGTKDPAYMDKLFTYIKVEKDVTLLGEYGMCFLSNIDNGMYPLCYGVKVDFYGTSNATAPAYVSGNIGLDNYVDNIGPVDLTNNLPAGVAAPSKAMSLYGPKFNVYGKLNTSSKEDQGITLSGWTTVNVYEGAEISGGEAVGIKAGILNVYGGTLTSIGDKQDPVEAVNSGHEASGAAISVTTFYTHNLFEDSADMAINIYDGEIKGGNNSAVLVTHSYKDGTPVAANQGIDLNIVKGKFTSASGIPCIFVDAKIDADVATYPSKFVAGGFYSDDSVASYVLKDFAAAEIDAAPYAYIVGKKAASTAKKIIQGKFNVNPAFYVANDYSVQASGDDDYPFEVKLGTSQKFIVFEKDADTNVDSDIDQEEQKNAKDAVSKTVVDGLAESLDAKKEDLIASILASSTTRGDLTTSIVENAKSVALEIEVVATAVESKTVVTEGQEAERVLSFELKPYATIKAISSNGEELSSERAKISNDFLDKTLSNKISVTVGSTFEPEQVVHVKENGEAEAFTKGAVASFQNGTFKCESNGDGYDITVEILQFSSLKFLAKVKYQPIVVNANGGTGTQATVYGLPNAEVVLPECTLVAPKNTEFAGWKVGDTVYQAGEKALFGDTLEMTATWKSTIVYGDIFMVKAIANTKTADFTWTNIKGAVKYRVYFAKCVKKDQYRAVITTTETSFTKKSLKKGTSYKAYVVAYDKNGKKIGKTPVIHFVAKGGKYSNPTSMKVARKSLILEKGKTFKLVAKVKSKDGKGSMLYHVDTRRYYSSNTKVATVDSKGKIKAVSAGKATIYVLAENGIYGTTKVTVE